MTMDASAHAMRAALLPRRRCAGTNAHFPGEVMVRYVLAMDGEGRKWVTPDARGDAPGRGTYVSANPRALELAIKRKAFEMGFKQREVHVPVTLETMTRRVLRARLGEVLTSACDSAREVRALTDARGEEKPTLTEPVTADEWIEILVNAQKRIVPDNWALIPRISGHIDADVNARLERSQLESAESHIGFGLSALTMDEIIASLDASGKDREMVTNILGCLRKFRSTGDLSDAPVLVGIDGDVSFALRLAQLKVQLFER